MKIAVIGSGISGLAAAWYLSKRHEVTLCERAPKIGMDAHSVEIDCGNESVHLNAPMRVFFEGYYPTLTQLYDEIGAAYEPIEYSGSFSRHGGKTYFRYRNHLFGSRAIPFLAGRSAFSPQALRIGIELIRFLHQARQHRQFTDAEALSLQEYLQQNRYSDLFAQRFLYPAFAGICTCSYESIKAYPVSIIMEYLDSDLTWSRINRLSQGTHDVTERLAAAASKVRCNLHLKAVTRNTNGVSITDGNGYTEDFDHVVVATQANQAQRLLANASSEEKNALAKFKYEKSRILVHKDAKLAPENPREWAPVNFLLSDKHDKPMASIWMNHVYPQLGKETSIFETWNPFAEIDARQVLIDAKVERPVVSQNSLLGISELNKLHQQHDRRVWFCGSYAGPGIPLLESAVVSAKAVARQLNAAAPLSITEKPTHDTRMAAAS